MTRHADTDLLLEVSRLLQYHESLDIKEYPQTQKLERFLSSNHGPTAPPHKMQAARDKAERTGQTPEKKHFFDPGLAKKVTLQDVRQELGDCKCCPLHKTRSNIVFGKGPETAKLMIVTDAPSGEDDRLKAPVQGRAGELLDKMLTAIGLSREEVYITTLVKCYPGENAKPREHEIKTCLPFLFRQIELICPTIICTMGMLASQTLLHSRKSLFQLRGRFYIFNDLCNSQLDAKIMLMPSLHPALLLDNTDLKRASWHDLQMIQKKLEDSGC